MNVTGKKNMKYLETEKKKFRKMKSFNVEHKTTVEETGTGTKKTNRESQLFIRKEYATYTSIDSVKKTRL